MILQSILSPCAPCLQKELYYQSASELAFENGCMFLPDNSQVSFFSYINMFDTDVWGKYTDLSKVYFSVDLKGSGCISVKCKTQDQQIVLSEYDFSTTKSWETFSVDIDLKNIKGCCYFEIVSRSKVIIQNARFETSEPRSVNKEIQIALNICTYHRNTDINRNLKQLKESLFFSTKNELSGKLYVMVVDNGSELDLINEPNIKLVHNPNTGGSGGFKRGLVEIRKLKNDITHVVFMDDDVEFFNETLYRLYALLSYIKKEYCQEPIAGRMFRADRRWIQYTAAEIWNRGDLKHIGLNADMTQEQEILRSNQNTNAEYGGWWFCCYPMSFASKNDPMPFFIHCDDVEYGLRHGGTPMILNGIQVWHETYEYRQSPVITYYDMRNTLILNTIMYPNRSPDEVLKWWKDKITGQHIQKEYLMEYMMILGMLDYLKGQKYFESHNALKRNLRIKRKKEVKKVENCLLWRLTERIFRSGYKKASLTFTRYYTRRI